MTRDRSDPPVLTVEDLTVRLPTTGDRENAVEGINLEVRRNEILCVVGESGSGKSVTAQAVMGLLPKGQLTIAGGRIRLLETDLLAISAAQRRRLRGNRMAMVFQEPMTALNPVITVGKQIEEVFIIHTDYPAAERARRVLALMRSVNLPDPAALVHTYPHQLSGGQRQRVMIAMALALDPVLLIADEPTTAVDVTTQAKILELIRHIQREHSIGVLFITHDFGVVAEIADKVAVMQTGRIVETGPVADVLDRPQAEYTKMLISSVPSLTPAERDTDSKGVSALQVDGLSKTYASGGFFQKSRRVRAATNVDFVLHRGETLGIVGESGSGKSTVARCIARLVDPTDGHILLHGSDLARLSVSRLRPHRKKIQIIFQDPYRSLNPRRTVLSSLIEGLTNYGTSRRAASSRAHEMLELVGIDPRSAERYPHQFSGGQRQRICIARALLMEPEVLIADEAVSALDVSVQAQVLALLDDIKRRFSLALLFITHDLRVAAQVCDTVAVMHEGKIVEQGTASKIFGSPEHDYTRSLIEAAPGRHWQFGVVPLQATNAPN